MVNNIKPTELSSVIHQKVKDNQSPKKVAAEPAASSTSPQKNAAPEIKVTNNLSHFVDLVLAESQVPDESARIEEMRNKIAAKEYTIDHDALAKKIFNQLFGG